MVGDILQVGYMGEIVFSVAREKMLTPSNFERESAGRWAEHALLMRKPVSQFGGPGLEKLNFNIILDIDHGIKPEEQLQKLRKMRDTGAVFPLFIGDKPVTQNYWRLDSLKENNNYWSAKGELIQSTVALELTEYENGNKTEENAIKTNSQTDNSTSGGG